MTLSTERSDVTTKPDTMGNRRTFAIISHPDAGKTTLTEKLLLRGGAIRLAGAVRARGEQRRTRSDWMKIEQSRGISVTTSVMTFGYGDMIFNLLDTPGHEDFSEDTYRTLTAVDSAIMVIDAAKGIEAQTRKLFEVCRLRDLPIITFINKMDREALDPLELLDEIADVLALDTAPLFWPAGMGNNFKGCAALQDQAFHPFVSGDGAEGSEETRPMDESALTPLMGAEAYEAFEESVELVQAGYPAFDLEAYRAGNLTPVLFGSALRDFGVDALLETIAAYSPPPGVQAAEPRPVQPDESKVTGFVFKVQANMDPNHRDRIAFLRLCSGRFKRGMKLHQTRSGKKLGVNNAMLFFAQDRDVVEEAWPGDVVGIPNHGTLRVGDTLTEGENLRFTGIPNFAPEILQRVRLDDPMRAKQLRRALEDLAEEGVTQVFRPLTGAAWIVGVVGSLQLDVLSQRIEVEYGLRAGFEAAPYGTARWVSSDDPAKLKEFLDSNRSHLAEDRDDDPVFLARNDWELNYTRERWPSIEFKAVKERG